MSGQDEGRIRLDKWLWAARFYRTRALARAAIESGRVQSRGVRCKPSREPRVGDELTLRTGFDERTVQVLALSAVRRGAPEAQQLYQETPDSIRRREDAAALRRAAGQGIITDGRPTKKQRRQQQVFHEHHDHAEAWQLFDA